MGVLYILDEPSIGLHQRDNDRLIAHARSGCATSATRSSSSSTTRRRCAPPTGSIDIGPRRRRARRRADRARARSTRSLRQRRSITGALPPWRAGDPGPATAAPRKRANGSRIERRAREQPAGTSTSASRSGSSSASPACPAPASRTPRHRDPLPGAGARSSTARATAAGEHDRIAGIEQIDKVIEIDQSPDRPHAALQPGDLHRPLRRRSASCFAAVPEARLRGYKPGRFSFNVKGGRCEACQGDGDHADRDALPARRLRAVRGLQGQALQPRDARDPLQGQERSPRSWR